MEHEIDQLGEVLEHAGPVLDLGVGGHIPSMLVIITKDFDERATIEIVHDSTGEVLRSDPIDLAIMSLFGFGMVVLNE